MFIIGETGEGGGKYGNFLLSADFFCKFDMVLRNIIITNYKKRRNFQTFQHTPKTHIESLHKPFTPVFAFAIIFFFNSHNSLVKWELLLYLWVS